MKGPIALALFAALAVSAQAATLNVPADYPTIQAAVNAAQAGDVVMVAAGTYSDVTHQPGGGDTTFCAVIMKNGITIRGAGVGQTILDANSLGRAFHCANVATGTIRDLTIREAFAQVYGAAILCKDGSSPTILNVDIRNNLDGGLICLNGSSPTVTNCTFTSNVAKQGGAIDLQNDCSPLIDRCTMSGNSSPSGGGVFIRANSNPLFRDCIIQNNFIIAANGGGGGVAVVNASPVFTNCQIINNIADGSGGGLFLQDNCNVTMNGCLIQGNRTEAAYGPGGGIYTDFCELTLNDCTITRNTTLGVSSDGAGVYAFFSSPVMDQVTIAANACSGNPGGAGGIGMFFSSPTITNTIIAFNSPGSAMYCTDPGDNPFVKCCAIFGNAGGDAICGTDGGRNFNLDPRFCDLANNNFRLHADSPCYPGHHPDGPLGNLACGNRRIGSQDPGCNPAGAGDADAPSLARVLWNEPNPFHRATTICFSKQIETDTAVAIYDLSGREIRTLIRGTFPAGSHRIAWDGRTDDGALLSSGVYFVRLTTEGKTTSRAVLLTR